MKATQTKRQKIYNKCGGRCAYCGCSLLDNFTVDHIKPRAVGGTWRLKNLNPACYDCNEAKGAMTIEDFRSIIKCKGWLTDKTRIPVDKHLAVTFDKFEGRKVVFYFEDKSKIPIVKATHKDDTLPRYATMAGFGFYRESC